MRTHYALKLWEPSVPGFCSFTKTYIGEKQDLLSVAAALEKVEAESETAMAIRSFFAGNRDAVHHIAYQEFQVLTPVRVLASSTMLLPERTWEHMNASHSAYRMWFASAKVDQIVVRYERKYHRCLKACITGLCYEGINGGWREVGSTLWGNASILDVRCSSTGQKLFSSILYIQEETSEEKSLLIQNLNDTEAVLFDQLCDEVFGYG